MNFVFPSVSFSGRYQLVGRVLCFFLQGQKEGKLPRWRFQIFIPTWGNDPIWRAYFSDGFVQLPTCYKWRPEQIDQKRKHLYFLGGLCKGFCYSKGLYIVGILYETAYSGTLSTNRVDGMGYVGHIFFYKTSISLEAEIWKMSLLFGAEFLAGIVVWGPVSKGWDHLTWLMSVPLNLYIDLQMLYW